MLSQQEPPRQVSRLRLGIGLLTGPIAWGIHATVSYALAPLICAAGSTIWLHLATIVTALVTLAAGIVSYGAWRLARSVSDGSTDQAAFLALSGIFMSGMFLLIILVESIPAFYLGAC